MNLLSEKPGGGGGDDELRALRERSQRLAPRVERGEAPPGGEVDLRQRSVESQPEKKKDAKKKKKKKKERQKERGILDGRHPSKAAVKTPQALFQGTALDQDEKRSGRGS